MPVTPEQARAELARRELARRELARRESAQPSAQAQREAERPDMAGVLQKEVMQPWSADPGTNLLRAGVTGIKAMGAGGQAMENFLSAPIVNEIRRRKGEKLGPTDILGHELGQNKTEFGDIARELGMPEWVSAPSGLIASSVTDPTQAGYNVGSKVVLEAEKRASSISRGLTHIFNVAGLNHNLAESLHLTKGGGYESLTEDVMKHTHGTAQTTANNMVRQWHDLFMTPARKAYDNISSKISARKLTNDENKKIVAQLSGVLGKERNAVAVQRVLDTDIGKVAKLAPEKPAVEKSYKKVTTFPQTDVKVDEVGGSIDKGGKKTSKSIEKVTKSDLLTGEDKTFTSKIVDKTEVTKRARAQAVQKPRTVQDLLNEIAAGKTPTARDWDSVSQELKRISGVADGKDPTASKAAEAIDEALHQYVPELKQASDQWKTAMDAKADLEKVVGRWNDDLEVENPDNLLQFFKHGADSPTQSGMRGFSAALARKGAVSDGSTIRNLAAYKTNVGPFRPALTALSLGGGLGLVLNHVGVPTPVVGAVAAAGAFGLTPYLSAKSGRTLTRAAILLRNFAEAPGGKYLMGAPPKDPAVAAFQQAVGRLLDQGAYKGVTQNPVSE